MDHNEDDLARQRKKRTWKRKLKQLRIATWNITSLYNKDQEILIELRKHKIDICSLSETKKKGKGNTKLTDYILIYSGKDKNERATSGVGICIHESFERNLKDIIYINDRILQTTLAFKEKKATHIISVYAPDMSKSQEEKNNFYYELQNTLDRISKKDEIIILGDLNARVGNKIIQGIKNRFNEKIINENGQQLIDFCAENELRINNTFYPHKPQHKYTFENKRGHKSMIDYIITNKNVQPSEILDVRVLTSANTGTNHNLVLSKIRTPIMRKEKLKLEIIEKLNIESFADDTFRNLYQNRFTQKINENRITEEDDTDAALMKVHTNIMKAAEEALIKRKVDKNGKHNKKPWFTNEVKSLAAEKRKSYLKYRSKTITYREYKITRNRVNDNIQLIKRGYWEKFLTDMEHDLYGGQRKIWNMLRNHKKPVNEYIQTTTITTRQWEKYFHNLYDSTAPTITQEIQDEYVEKKTGSKMDYHKRRNKDSSHLIENSKNPWTRWHNK